LTARWLTLLADRCECTPLFSAIGQLEAVRAGGGIGVLHDYLARSHDDLVPVLPAQRAVRSYWTAIHENLRDVSRVRAAAQFLAESDKLRIAGVVAMLDEYRITPQPTPANEARP
jgi:DNA-binding transcriptional LysR family regulator